MTAPRDARRSPGPALAAGLPFVLSLVLAAAAPAQAQQGAEGPHAVLERMPPGDHFLEATLPSGETLLYTLHVPEAVAAGRPVPLIVGLHYGAMTHPHVGGAYLHQLVLPALKETGAILVAPDAMPVPGAEYRMEGWTSERNKEAVLWLTRSLLATYSIDRSRVAVTGYSRGGGGTWWMAENHPELFSAAIAVSSTPAYQVVEGVKIPVYVIHSIDDEVIGSVLVQGAVEQLQQAGADVQIRIIRGPKHYMTDSFVPHLSAAIPWLEEAWRKREGGR